MDSELRRYALAMAAPLVRHHGGDLGVLGGIRCNVQGAHKAAVLLRELYGVKSAEGLDSLVSMFENYGQRAEYGNYAYHVARNWSPPPNDPSVVRKAEFARKYLDVLANKSLWAWDTVRMIVVAGWGVTSRLWDEQQALSHLSKLIDGARKAHETWQSFGEGVLLGQLFFSGKQDAELLEQVAWLNQSPDSPWSEQPFPALKNATETNSDKQEATSPNADYDSEYDVKPHPTLPALKVPPDVNPAVLTTVASELTLNCPECMYPLWPDGITDSFTCPRCNGKGSLSPDDWRYLLANDVSRTLDRTKTDQYTTDFGKRFLSQRRTWLQDPKCKRCDNPIAVDSVHSCAAQGVLVCSGCGQKHSIRPGVRGSFDDAD